MKKFAVIAAALFILANICTAQPPAPVWTQSIEEQFSQNLARMDYAVSNGYVAVGTDFTSLNSDTARIVYLNFDDSGNIVWQQTLQLGGIICRGYDIQKTWDGNYIIAASSSNSASAVLSTSHLIKVTSTGNILWTGSFDDSMMSPWTRVTCAYGNDYLLLGNIYTQGQGYNIRVRRVSQSGSSIWSSNISGNNLWGRAIVAGFDPGFYIAGSVYSFPNQSTDFNLTKINENGNVLWTISAGDSGVFEELVDIRRTNDGKLIAVGNSFANGQNNKIVLIKYDLNGNVIWERLIGEYQYYIPSSVFQDPDGGYLISGWTNEQMTLPIIIKTNAAGYVRWVSKIENGNSASFGYAMPSFFPPGYVAVGSNYTWTNGENMFLAKLNADPASPVSVWPSAPYDINLPFTGGQFSFSLTVTNESVYAQNFDIWTYIDLPGQGEVPILTSLNRSLPALGSFSKSLAQYVPATAPPGEFTYHICVGNYPWQVYYSDSFTFTKSGGNGDVGSGSDTGWKCEGWFTDDTLPVNVRAIPKEVSLANYPNPFNPATTINFSLPNSTYVTLRVYDINGREVTTLVNGYREAGSHSVTFDGSGLSSGIYIYCLEANNHTASGKMMLVK